MVFLKHELRIKSIHFVCILNVPKRVLSILRTVRVNADRVNRVSGLWTDASIDHRPVTPNLVPPKSLVTTNSCPAWALIEYKLYTVEALGLGFG